MTNDERSNFIKAISNAVLSMKDKYGIQVASPIIAQAILESKWGQSVLSKAHFNYFGMKCGSSYSGLSVNMATKEVYSGKTVSIRSNFRAYTSMTDGIKGYFDFIQAKRYADLKNCITPESYIDSLVKAGYATSPTYKVNLMKVIDTYNLKQYDFATFVPKGFFEKTPWLFKSIVEALKYIGVDSSFNFREKIFEYNYHGEYKGTSEQNAILCKSLSLGTLRIPA